MEGINNYFGINIYFFPLFGVLFLYFYVRIVFFRLIWPHFDCIEGIFVFLASFCHFGLMKWPFPYESRPYFLLYCPAAQTGAKSGYSALKSSYTELSFLYIRHYCQILSSYRKKELKNSVLCSNLKTFLITDSKVPNFNLSLGAFLGKNFTFHLIGTSNYDV